MFMVWTIAKTKNAENIEIFKSLPMFVLDTLD